MRAHGRAAPSRVPRSMNVRGTLIENGKEIADFEAERGAMAAAGTCSTLREGREGAGLGHRRVAPASEAARPPGRQVGRPAGGARDPRRAAHRARAGASVSAGPPRGEQETKAEEQKRRVRRDAQGRAHLVIQRDDYGTAGRAGAVAAAVQRRSGRTTSPSPPPARRTRMLAEGHTPGEGRGARAQRDGGHVDDRGRRARARLPIGRPPAAPAARTAAIRRSG